MCFFFFRGVGEGQRGCGGCRVEYLGFYRLCCAGCEIRWNISSWDIDYQSSIPNGWMGLTVGIGCGRRLVDMRPGPGLCLLGEMSETEAPR
jgi:hypothetical protein